MTANTPGQRKELGYEGFAQLAHAIRRSTALTVAMYLTPEGSTEDELFATADRCADWIRGKAEDLIEKPKPAPAYTED